MNNRITRNWIESLEPNEIFVFGSNINGWHFGGAAKIAYQKFGAIEGVSEGLQGKSYGINTMSGISVIKEQINTFINHCINTPKNIYLVTELGCGIAGYTPNEIATLLFPAVNIDNIHLPESFWKILNND